MAFHSQSSWSVGHLPVVSEDICVGHDVLGTREPSCADGTGEPRICGWFHIRGAEGSTRASLPLTNNTQEPSLNIHSPGDAPAPPPCGQTGTQR